jgi:polar amino acid transport system permease protein
MIWSWDFTWQILPKLLAGLVVTVEATFLGSLLAFTLGLPLAVARFVGGPLLRRSVGAIAEFIRRTPLLVQLYLLFYVLPDLGVALSPLTAGVIGLGLHYSTYAAEVYRAGLESVPRGQWEAAKALNYTTAATFTRVILPQAIPPIIPALSNYVISMFKETPILSAITVIELMNAGKIVANEYYRYIEPMTMVGLLFLLISLPTSLFSLRIERWAQQRARE